MTKVMYKQKCSHSFNVYTSHFCSNLSCGILKIFYNRLVQIAFKGAALSIRLSLILRYLVILGEKRGRIVVHPLSLPTQKGDNVSQSEFFSETKKQRHRLITVAGRGHANNIFISS